MKKNNISIKESKIKYPIGCFVVSKLNSEVRGFVCDYSDIDEATQLICEKNNGGRVRIFVTNAVRI